MKASISQALARLPATPSRLYPEGAPFVTMLAGGTMSVEVFAPKLTDRQTPHNQDELYFVHSGRGEIVIAGQRFEATAGNAFFVAAQVAHRFENFSDDFVTWVVFYGPPGGE
jgi:mannose-6-phosphate isomerase-like protein (cupin superfamily)